MPPIKRNAVAGTAERFGFRLESVRVRSNDSAVNSPSPIFFAVPGQSEPLPVPPAVWIGYLANGNKIGQLEAKIKSLEAAAAKQIDLAELQYQAGMISPEQLGQAAWDAGINRDEEVQSMRKSIAELQLRQNEVLKQHNIPSDAVLSVA
jgi:hypothetical protein